MDTFIDKPMVLADLAARRRAFELPWQWAALGAILLASCGHLLIKVGLTAAIQQPRPKPSPAFFITSCSPR